MAVSLAYGPVPSRRIGRSIGINNVPPKVCSYSCVYCQLGRSLRLEIKPRQFYKPDKVVEKAGAQLEKARQKGEPVDFLTFVPDGEPSLDANLSKEIESLKTLGMRIAIITNGSLLWREDVRQILLNADWISLKVDAASHDTWRRVDRPHKSLDFEAILKGMLEFAQGFRGELTTETMLVRNLNDDLNEIKKIADFLIRVKPSRAYIGIPTRPPAEPIEPATEQTVNTAYQLFSEKLERVEYLIGYEGNAFACTGDVQDDLLSITAVHPMREEAIAEFLKTAGAGWQVVQQLIEERHIVELEYRGKKFYMRKLPGRS
jgi:wyosine [tRNA(Phe)-imidazoG37] synthetase (radical SAM superfamily)